MVTRTPTEQCWQGYWDCTCLDNPQPPGTTTGAAEFLEMVGMKSVVADQFCPTGACYPIPVVVEGEPGL